MANFSKPAGMMSMLFAFLSVLQFSVAFEHGAHQAQPALSGRDVTEMMDQLHKRQSRNATPIKGVCSSGYASNGQCNGGSTAAPRLEIRDLANNADMWNLFLLGMERFESKDKSEVFSYYQLCGVHGRPFVGWNGYPTPLSNQAGFCPHSMTLFGSWHRPYLAAYEV